MTNEQMVLRIQEGDDLYSDLWERLKRLLFKFANRHHRNCQSTCISAGDTIDGLCQETYLALLYAIKAYSPDIDYSFASYLPLSCKNQFRALLDIHSGHPDPLNTSTSLDTPIGEEEDITILDCIADDNSTKAFDTIEHTDYINALRTDVHSAIDALKTPMQQQVIKSRFFDNQTLAQTAHTQGVSSDRVRVIQGDSLRQLRLNKRILKYRDDFVWRHSLKHSGLRSEERRVGKEC